MNSLTLRFGSLALLIALGAPSAKSQVPIKPEKQALIRELYALTQASGMADAVFNVISTEYDEDDSLLESQVLGGLFGKQRDDLKKAFEENSEAITRRVLEKLRQKVDVAREMEQVFFPIYDKFYTEDELRDIIAFYKTPTGKKSLQLAPQITSEAMQRSSQVLAPKIDDALRMIVREERDQLMKKQP